MNVFVINLPRREDRRRDMERQLQRIGWNAEFFPAIEPDNAGSFASRGCRGCFLSHLAVLEIARERQLPRVTILEDDVNFRRDFATYWPAVSRFLEQAKWSLFYGGHVEPFDFAGVGLIEPGRHLMCSHFLTIGGTALPTMISGLETMLSRPGGHPEGGPMHVDGAYSTLRQQNPSLVSYAHSPSLGYQRTSRSDIADAKWFDRFPISVALDAARKLKSQLGHAEKLTSHTSTLAAWPAWHVLKLAMAVHAFFRRDQRPSAELEP